MKTIMYALLLVSNPFSTDEVLGASAWRDFFPPTTGGTGLLISIDTKGTVHKSIDVKVTHIKSGQTWNTKLSFTYFLEENNKNKGQRYHSKKSGPTWPVGDEILIEVLGKKIKTKIEATH